MKELADGTKVSSRTYYYLLEVLIKTEIRFAISEFNNKFVIDEAKKEV